MIVGEALRRRRLQFLAGQFARPSGLVGRWWIGPWLDRLSRDMNRAAFDALAPAAGERVVEIGFGGGDLLQMVLDQPVERLLGVDISEAMVKRAARRFRGEIAAGRLQLVLGSAESLPIGDGGADRLCSVNNIYFWEEPEDVIEEFARVLAPGGRAVICLETPASLRGWPGHRYGFQIHEPDDVADMLIRSGFTAATVSRQADPKLGEFATVSAVRS